MLTGRFGDTSGRPYIEARLILPRLGIKGEISFLVDTGADSSVLMPADAIRLGVPFDQLEGDSEMGGIGGTIRSFVERGILLFSEPGVGITLTTFPPSTLPRMTLPTWTCRRSSAEMFSTSGA